MVRPTSTYQDNTTAPHVDLATSVQRVTDDQLGCGIAWTTTARLHEVALPHAARLQLVQAHALDELAITQIIFLLFRELLCRLEGVREAKIGNDNVAVPVQQQVFQLQISVHDALLV